MVLKYRVVNTEVSFTHESTLSGEPSGTLRIELVRIYAHILMPLWNESSKTWMNHSNNIEIVSLALCYLMDAKHGYSRHMNASVPITNVRKESFGRLSVGSYR